MNIGDIVFQLFAFVVLISIILGIGFFFRLIKKRKEQLDRLEEKIDQLSRENKKSN